MNRRGIEGLPLKYLVIALVGSLVIALALQMTSLIQGSVIESTDLVAESITGRIIESTLGEKYTLGFDVMSVFNWYVNSSATTKDVMLSLINPGSEPVNITDISVSFSGSSDNEHFDDGLFLQPGESTEAFFFNPSGTIINEGDRVSVSVIITFDGGSVDSGSLVGFAQ